MKNYRPASTNIDKSASGDCMYITGELQAIIKIEDKIASGKVYVADSRQPFGTSHSILSAMQYSDPQIRVPLWNKPKKY